jgi:hypothetical protein
MSVPVGSDVSRPWPPKNAWWLATMSASIGELNVEVTISTPIRSCMPMIFHSSAVSGAGLSKMWSGTPILPMSCNRAATSST